MGRPESRLVAGSSALRVFAADLRQLRHDAGSPSYRTLAGQAHFSASTLSRAAGGRALPTLEVTLALVRACGGDEPQWRQRWQATAAQLDGVPCDGAPCDGAPCDGAPCDGEPATVHSAEPLVTASASTDPSGADAPSTDLVPTGLGVPFVRRHQRWLTLAASVLAVGLVAALAMLRFGGPAGPADKPAKVALPVVCVDSAPPSPGPDPVADCSNPSLSGCSTTAVGLGSVNVHFPADQYSGQIELRYSPQCRSAWARFNPSPDWKPGPGVLVTVAAVRPADGASTQFSAEFGSEAVYSGMLMTAPGCVAVEVLMRRGTETAPTAATPCLLPG